ncbi:MAG: hypothetical protein ABL876_01115 [Chitinophagaceae bacterium]
MTKTISKKLNVWVLLPLLGTVLFVCLYFVATLYYPGGSQVDIHSKGFSWTNNYWCNLLNESSVNGQPNPARPVAMSALFVLCLTLAIFWYLFPKHTGLKGSVKLVIQISGALAMTTAMFLFTDLHDTIVNSASLCGLVATLGTFIGLHQLRWTKLFWFGIFNLALVALNSILYYGDGLKLYLPVVQKITFLFFLLWICLITIDLYHRQAKNNVV